MPPSTFFPRCSSSRSARTGFTLIELLIVVAIIAVLAAIAVPNFLEAQTRSKVSRARADLRSIATALETYRVDNNRYPSMLSPGFSHAIPCLVDFKWWYTPNVLSTPIAYITSADTICPFGGDLPQRDNFPDRLWRRYSYENVPELERRYVEGCAILAGKYGPDKNARNLIGQWRVLSIGPNNAWNPMVLYDPSNGTVSAGNIMRTQADSQGYGSEQRP